VLFRSGYSTFEYSQDELRSDSTTTDKFGIVVGNKTAGGQDYSVKLDMGQAEWGNGSVSNGVEVRARQNFTAGPLTPYLGGRVGQRLKSDESFTHYAVDVGVKFPIVGALSGDVGYRYRNAFDTANTFESNRYHATASYAVTKTDSIGVRYSRAYGDSGEEKNTVRVSWTHNF
jgi:opacity protein-like surface antigen